MKPPIHYLDSADNGPWLESVAVSDGMPIRESGPWIATKHELLAYYAHLFATGMKNKFRSRVYLELFSGPGKCVVRDTGKEELGSPLKVIGSEFTRFIFTELRQPAAEALAARLSSYPGSERSEIWCGDCSDAIQHLPIPRGSLTFAFIDPTGIKHAPFSLIERLHRATRCDLLINIQHGMGIKMNVHQYTPDAHERSALTRFLGNEGWKRLPQHNRTDFFRGVLDLYKQQLDSLGFAFTGREVLIRTQTNTPLYLLLFASKHKRGQQFWEESRRRVMERVDGPELDLGV